MSIKTKTLNALRCLAAVVASLGLTSVAAAQSANDATTNFTAVAGDWNDPANWLTKAGEHFVPGDNGATTEVPSVSNGGTAFLDAPASFPVQDMHVGVDGGLSSVLEIRPGGSLTATGAAFIGYEASGKLRVNGGAFNAAAAILEPTGVLEFSNGANATIGAILSLGEVRFLGSDLNVAFTDGFLPGGKLTFEITAQTFNPIVSPFAQVNARAININFNGVTPELGDSWTLVDADTINTVVFWTPKVTGVEAPRGVFVGPVLDGASGDLKVVAENRLILSVDRTTGAVSMENVIDRPIPVVSYKITSQGGHLADSVGRWSSFQEQGVGDFTEEPSSENEISEIGGVGFTFEIGAPESLGTPYDFTPTKFGESGEDLVFEYTTSDGGKDIGFIEYTGPINNLVLTVDPSTGEAILENQSKFAAAITDYAIGSASGSLTPEGWASLEDGGVASWSETSATSGTLSEAIAAAFAVSSGTTFQLGDIFSLTGERDLTLAFALEDGTQMNGIVLYGEIASTVVGDTDDDGDVDLDDLNNVRNNFGAAGLGDTDGDNDVDLDDLNNVRNNFGAEAASNSVPEPSTILLAALGGIVLAVRRATRRA